MKRLFILVIMLIISASSFSQIAMIGSISAKPGDTINVPLIAVDLNQINVFALSLEYDKTKLKFIKFHNFIPDFKDSLWYNDIINNSGDINNIRCVWLDWVLDSIEGITIDSSKVFDMKFVLLGGTSTISFDTTNCIIENVLKREMNVTYINGIVDDLTTDITEAESEFYDISPNPGSDYLTVNLKNIKSQNIKTEIFDIRGKLLYTKYINLKNNLISISNLADGIYILRLSSKDQSYSKKLIIKH
ncbi:MAG: T9SS type A sorting domain-containing protein [Bacteroidales bacterium]|nr:T9SS type A sorting domain-containing protein [Bacteroidales bacterium]